MSEAKPEAGDLWVHRKTGGVYFVRGLGALRLQCGDSTHDSEQLVEYLLADSPESESERWARPLSEFIDGRFSYSGRYSARVDAARQAVDDLVVERRRRLAEWSGTVAAFDAAGEHAELHEQVRVARSRVEMLLARQARLEGR